MNILAQINLAIPLTAEETAEFKKQLTERKLDLESHIKQQLTEMLTTDSDIEEKHIQSINVQVVD